MIHSRPSLERLPDGRWHLTLSKSWLGTYRMCPAWARHILDGPEHPDPPTWQAELGTAAHLGIEHTLIAWRNGGGVNPTHPAIYRAWHDAFDAWADAWREHDLGACDNAPTGVDIGHRWIADIANRWVSWATSNLHRDVGAWRIEERFTRTLLDDERAKITLTGVVDLCTADRAYDWKTGSPPAPWEVDRYDHQTAIYSYLTERVCSLVFVPRTWDDEPVTVRTPLRHAGHLDALTEELLDLIAHADIERWQRRPSGWWCSSRWCGQHAAGACQGAHVQIHGRNNR